jgi:superfamily II DNA or RNA helicase
VSGVKLSFSKGSLIIEGNPEILDNLPTIKWDERSQCYRALARDYRFIIEYLISVQIPYEDNARAYNKIAVETPDIQLRPHQREALDAFRRERYLGCVCLPTGAGKTILAIAVMAELKRSTLVVVPTIDLLFQWADVIEKFLKIPAGKLGGGHHQIEDITVSTYDSAVMFMEHYGNRFAFIVFDECHHLPATQNQFIANAAIAPFRLGLSATLERSDGKETLLYEIVGPLVFEGHMQSMIGQGLAPYQIVTQYVEMSEAERLEYEEQRGVYLHFIRANGINMSKPNAWMDFVIRSARSQAGREAMKAFRRQKKIAQASESKLTALWEILFTHVGEKIIVFTDDNQSAYEIGERFYLAVLTHQTKAKERKRMLDEFRSGQIRVLVTSKVLNEGVDVPEASVGIVMSGSGAVREHVQRLGRILRQVDGKRATLYEIVAKDSSETYINRRRKDHQAYAH